MGLKFAASLLFALACHGSPIDPVPLLDIVGGGVATVPLADASAGWQFNMTSAIRVTALGLWDEASLPLEIMHDVGLWNRDGSTLLASALVGNGSDAVPSVSGLGQWLFTRIDTITLKPGTYVLGAVWGDPVFGAAPFRIGTMVKVSGRGSYVGPCEATQLPSPVLVFPTCGPGSSEQASFFGPNLEFTPNPPRRDGPPAREPLLLAVPEPSSVVLTIAPLAAMLRRRASERRRG